jgi:hypothetical protein
MRRARTAKFPLNARRNGDDYLAAPNQVVAGFSIAIAIENRPPPGSKKFTVFAEFHVLIVDG